MTRKVKYFSGLQIKKQKRKKYWLKFFSKKSVYFSIGLGIILSVLIADYFEDNIDSYMHNIINPNKIAYILVSNNINYFHKYLLVIGCSLIFLSPLIKGYHGHRNSWILCGIISYIITLFFYIFSFLKPLTFKRFYFVFLSFTIMLSTYGIIRVGQDIIKWVAPHGRISADSSKISVVWGILWAILVAFVILIWGKKID